MSERLTAPHGRDFIPLEARRLRLRRFTDKDLTAFMAYRNDPEVARYQSWASIDEPEARAFIDAQKVVLPGTPGRWFQMAIELKETGALIGDCALKINADDPRQAEIGFTLARQHQGRGFATEAVSRVITYAFQTFALHRVLAVTDAENVRSAALLERIGMRREGHFLKNVWFKGRWGDEYLFAILEDEWLRRI
jgi:RimJ/RimL family protein N-acetyltransferase